MRHIPRQADSARQAGGNGPIVTTPMVLDGQPEEQG